MHQPHKTSFKKLPDYRYDSAESMVVIDTVEPRKKYITVTDKKVPTFAA